MGYSPIACWTNYMNLFVNYTDEQIHILDNLYKTYRNRGGKLYSYQFKCLPIAIAACDLQIKDWEGVPSLKILSRYTSKLLNNDECNLYNHERGSWVCYIYNLLLNEPEKALGHIEFKTVKQH